MLHLSLLSFFFFFNDTATTEIYTLSLHDALPICIEKVEAWLAKPDLLEADKDAEYAAVFEIDLADIKEPDRKSTRLNSSHSQISYAVFCLKKKKKKKKYNIQTNIEPTTSIECYTQ